MSTLDIQESLLVQALERILCCMQTQVSSVTPPLQPGLTREQVEAQLQRLPFRLSEEVYQLYQWRNGNPRERGVEFLPQYRMIPLEEAVIESQSMYEVLADEDECHWLPFLAMDSNFYAIKGSVEFKVTAPISSFAWMLGLASQFNSLTDMMLAIAECFETGAYYLDNYSYLDFDRVRSTQIWLKYQPQRTANIQAILNNQAQRLSNEDQRQAYSDLVETQHPQALSVLIQAVEELEPDISSLRFQASHAQTPSEKADAIESAGPKESKLGQLIIQYLQNLTEIGVISPLNY
jgi:hypothetical protein